MRTVSRFALAGLVAGTIYVSSASAAPENGRVLLLSAYPAEQAVLLAAAGPVSDFGTFNGRRFFEGVIGEKTVILGLVGIGLVNSHTTAEAALDAIAERNLILTAMVFSGVAGGPNIGDVVIPHRWSDANDVYEVDPDLFAVAAGLVGAVELSPFLPVEDAACIGLRPDLLTPIRLTTDPVIRVGGRGWSSDPFGGRAVPCLSSAGGLLGCEACGAPPNSSPDAEKFLDEARPFFDPDFFQDLAEGFSGGGSSGAVVGDMETAAVARLAVEREIPFIAFRAVSDGGGDPNPVTAALGFPFQFFTYQQLAADNAAAVVIEFLERWDAEP